MAKPKIKQMQRDLEDLKVKVKENTNDIKASKEREIKRLLRETKAHNPSKHLYTYAEVADEVGCSKGTVSNVAAKNGMARLKAVK